MTIAHDNIAVLQAATHARIDLGRYEENIQALRQIAGPEKAFMAVIKANAYGHGAIACGHAAAQAGASYVAVARISEALQLRRSGLDLPLLVLGGPNLAQLDLAVQQNVTITVGAESALAAVQAVAQRTGERPIVHLKVDSGLHRYGFMPDLAFEIARRLAEDERVIFEGLYCHFSSADEPDPTPTRTQIERTERLLDRLAEINAVPRYVHLPNSAGTLARQWGRSNLVRAGIATYGLAPSPDVQLPDGVGPILTLHSKLTRQFSIPAGEGVSYGLTYRSATDEPAGVVPIGYADGLPRSLSNCGWFLVNGERCLIRGRVCMDQTVIGLAGAAQENDAVMIIGDGGDAAMTVDDIAVMDGTINYEIVAGLAARVPRIYYRDNVPVGWDDPILGESNIR